MSSSRVALSLSSIAGLSLLASGAAFAANPPSALDNAPSTLIPDISVGPGDIAPQRAIGRERTPSGNPLWGIPLSSLSATRDRPIFRPSRRAPAPAVLGLPRVEPAPAAVPLPERPQLTLVGAIVGDGEGIAVFVDASNTVVRLRTGQDYSGWVLNIVKAREATLQKDYETAVFAMPVPGIEGPAPASEPVTGGGAGPATGGAPGGALVMPNNPADFAPFVPRKTPKNGEHDGL